MNHLPPLLPRRLRLARGLRAIFLPALCALIATWSAAKAGGPSADEPRSVLHIQAQVVPVALLPSPKNSNFVSSGAVVYSMPSAEPEMAVIEEVRALDEVEGQATPGAVLKTLSIVPK